MKVSLIAAVALNGVMGRGSELPWHLRGDMKSFKAKTLGHHIIAGRKTFESFGSKPLPGRTNIIVTRDAGYKAADCWVAASLEAALDVARQADEPEVIVIGGAQIYEMALPLAQTFYRTRVLATVPGDVYFPSFDESQWGSQGEATHEADLQNDYPFVIETLTRLHPPG